MNLPSDPAEMAICSIYVPILTDLNGKNHPESVGIRFSHENPDESTSVRKMVRMACTPGSVRGPRPRGWPFIWDDARASPQAINPAGGAETPCAAGARPALFDLAAGGACRAAPVARGAVGSYPTVSPLPPRRKAVCSLWRFPSGRPGRALPGAVSPCSPDVPHPPREARPSGHPHDVSRPPERPRSTWSGLRMRARPRPRPVRPARAAPDPPRGRAFARLQEALSSERAPP